MTEAEIRSKLAKVYALVEGGATEGERRAAKTQLDKLLKKYNLEGINLDSLDKTDRDFKYSNLMEKELFFMLLAKFLTPRRIRQFSDARGYRVPCTHLEWVSLSCSYEYFRRHMMAQWRAVCLPEINKKRKAKTKNKRRADLQEQFSTRYFFLSGLLTKEQVREVPASELSPEALKDAERMRGVEGGKYSTQVQTGHQLPEAKREPVPVPNRKGQYSIF